MAKGRQRSSREAKKPKKAKPKVAPATSGSIWLTLEKAQPRDGAGKKK